VDVMTFELPPQPTDTASFLRELEQTCAKTTPKEVRAALITAAQELERWQKLGEDAARQLEEAANIRIGQMDSHARVDEIQRGVKRTLLDLARAFRELA
jgi:hypothetical protein